MSTPYQAVLYTPPRPIYSAEQPSLRRFLGAWRTNPLLLWPEAAYERDVIVNRQLGRTRILINGPDAIHRVLVENPGNYRRTPAAIRILRPVVGEGLVLSEGRDWRHQRRTIAPAIAPRVIPLLARHIGAVAEETVASLGARSHGPLNLLQEMQFAALEIASRSMFSLEMGAFGPEIACDARRLRHAAVATAFARLAAAGLYPGSARLRPLAVSAAMDGVDRAHHRRASLHRMRAARRAICSTCFGRRATRRRARLSPASSCAIRSRR